MRVSDQTANEPDGLVSCGPELSGTAIEVRNWVMVVEVASPSTRRIDTTLKLAGYFSLASVHHYLIINPEALPVIHDQRQGDGTILTRLVADGVVRMEPPGVGVSVIEAFSK